MNPPLVDGRISPDRWTLDGDNRSGYLSLHRSLENLLEPRRRIEADLIIRMRQTAEKLAKIDVTRLDNADAGQQKLQIMLSLGTKVRNFRPAALARYPGTAMPESYSA